ncbi:rhodanese-like domain-containing protein [Cytobacillus spongiae]|uniref:rhodanese-like domain-containing protein n=1 Tax=Cytobacillus spongiae TaxID=2901381 RepID=UPI001F26B0C2|nr:rhodanese-like domain-containing protein [Cytobacillus spongiae]UII55824.1 rhodanese-like domain-containing protein [Cytobacillus spongiae]
MRKLHLLFSLFLLVSIGLIGCSESSEASFENIQTEDAKALIDEQKIQILDVRSQEEYDSGHIPNAELIPLPELTERLSELDQSTTYLVVCRSGNRSSQASQILIDNGFGSVYNLENGMNEWAYEIE